MLDPPPEESLALFLVGEAVRVKKEEVKEEIVAPTPTAAVVDEDGAKTVEAIEETIVAVSSTDPPAAEEPKTEESKTEEPKTEESKTEEAAAPPPPPPEEVYIWGIKLLADEKSDVILLKFLRARDFKVKEAFTMIKNTVSWRKEFGVDSLLEEDLGNELDKVVFMKGVDREGHPVCYNVFGGFQDNKLYSYCFSDEEKRKTFLRWRIQQLEKSIRKLDFSPSGIRRRKEKK
ncbi:PATL3 [Linum grandiflorum]